MVRHTKPEDEKSDHQEPRIPDPLPSDLTLDIAAAYADASALPANGGEIEGYAQAAETGWPAAIRLANYWKADSAYIRDEFDLYAKQAEAGFAAAVSDLTDTRTRLAAAEAECERLRQEIEYWKLSALAKP